MNSIKALSAERNLTKLMDIELAIDSACQELSIESSRAYFITLAVSELASNMIRHGVHSAPLRDEIKVDISTSPNCLQIVLTDCCEPLPASVVHQFEIQDGTISDYETSIQNIPESGWGVDLIHNAASSVCYSRRNEHNVYELSFGIETSATPNNTFDELVDRMKL